MSRHPAVLSPATASGAASIGLGLRTARAYACRPTRSCHPATDDQQGSGAYRRSRRTAKGASIPRKIPASARFTASASEPLSSYSNPQKHAAALGKPVAISAAPGAGFSAFHGQVPGSNLLVEPNRMIVRSWRGSVWDEDDPGSIVVLTVADTASGGVINPLHAKVPNHCSPDIDWERASWQPWRPHPGDDAWKVTAKEARE